MPSEEDGGDGCVAQFNLFHQRGEGLAITKEGEHIVTGCCYWVVELAVNTRLDMCICDALDFGGDSFHGDRFSTASSHELDAIGMGRLGGVKRILRGCLMP